MDVSSMACGSGADECGVRPGKRVSFSLSMHVTVLQAEIVTTLACAKECIRRAYVGENI
jgi:hypothetical protein